MNLTKGTRIRLLDMPYDPMPVPAGSCGTVTDVTDLGFLQKDQTQVSVKWDNGRTLSMIVPPDTYEVLP